MPQLVELKASRSDRIPNSTISSAPQEAIKNVCSFNAEARIIRMTVPAVMI